MYSQWFPIAGIMKLQGYNKFQIPTWTGVAAIVVLLSVLTAWKLIVVIVRWWRKPIASNKRLYHELCKAHHLTSSEIQLLQKISTAKNLNPSFLFIDPEVWTDYTQGETEDSDIAKILFEKVFGTLNVEMK